MIGPREIEATAQAYHTQAEIIPGVAHNSMLELGWQNVAERILAWLSDREVENTSAKTIELAEVEVD
jgi:hypothetical protein